MASSIHSLKQSQNLILGKLQDRSAISSHFNEPSERWVAQVAPDFNRNTRIVGTDGGMSLKDGIHASGRKPTGKGGYQYSDKCGGNIDGYSSINQYEETKFREEGLWELKWQDQ
ncbi:hypothetical protein C5167_011575 [Papaver somniferum]|uniref:Photosystem II 10 kDa polypeptide, chloroplastic n=1 Tax=Papaver somniferum TaxID=3469 RepID=A0A4Y7K6R0_PAPSO|nr:hypothetical protein C5167_011575 [Papaver somniferum]